MTPLGARHFYLLTTGQDDGRLKAMEARHPVYCLAENPGQQTVYFGGKFIHLTKVAEKSGLSLSMISKVFSGNRRPSFISAKKIADALGMNSGAFIALLQEHHDSMVKIGKASRPFHKFEPAEV